MHCSPFASQLCVPSSSVWCEGLSMAKSRLLSSSGLLFQSWVPPASVLVFASLVWLPPVSTTLGSPGGSYPGTVNEVGGDVLCCCILPFLSLSPGGSTSQNTWHG